VELFEAIRRDDRVEQLSVRALADKYGVHRRTVRQALANAVPPEWKTPARVAPKLELSPESPSPYGDGDTRHDRQLPRTATAPAFRRRPHRPGLGREREAGGVVGAG